MRGRKSYLTQRAGSDNNKLLYVYGAEVDRVRHWFMEALMAIEDGGVAMDIHMPDYLVRYGADMPELLADIALEVVVEVVEVVAL